MKAAGTISRLIGQRPAAKPRDAPRVTAGEIGATLARAVQSARLYHPARRSRPGLGAG